MRLLLAVLAVSLALVPAASHALASYRYYSDYTIENKGAQSYTNVPVLLPVNAQALVDGGYLQADLRDAEVHIGGATAAYTAHLVDGPWEVFLPSLPAYSVVRARLYLGASPPVDQFSLVGTAMRAVAADAPGLNPGTQSLQLDTVAYFSGAQGEKLLYKKGAYGLYTSDGRLVGRVVPDTDYSLSPASSTSDGYISSVDADYTAAHDATVGDAVDDLASTSWIGQSFDGTSYHIYRAFVFFDTSALPDDAAIMAATLRLYGAADSSATDFDIVAVNGQPTYPHDPLQAEDYALSNYSGDGGRLNTASWIAGPNDIVLNETGLGWINPTGTTKRALVSSRDLAASAPTGEERVSFYTADYGSSHPTLLITYRSGVAEVSTAIPGSEATVRLSYNGALGADNLALYVDDMASPVATATAPGYSVSSAEDLVVSAYTRYTRMAKLTIAGALTGHWFGAVDSGGVSADLSGNGHSATVRGSVTNPANVTVSAGPLVPFQPIPAAKVGLPTVVEIPPTPAALYREGSGAHLPLGDVLERAAQDAGIPIQMVWFFIALGSASIVGLVVMRRLGSLALAALAVALVMGFWSLTGVLPMWTLFVFLVMAGTLLIWQRQTAL